MFTSLQFVVNPAAMPLSYSTENINLTTSSLFGDF